MERVMIVGGPGSGKSTLARELGALTCLPVHHMDHVHWKPGWEERPRDEKIAMALEIEGRSRWIFEGNMSATYHNRVARCDTFIWLDLPVSLRLWRVLRRTIVYLGKPRPDLPDGCPEKLGPQTVEFIGFILRTRNTSREKIRRLFDGAPDHVETIRLRSLSDVQTFLEKCRGLASKPQGPVREA